MTVWADLVGQEPTIETLSRAVSDESAMTHAWLFTGPPGSGRSTAARAFAAALECESAVPLTGKRDGEFDRVRLAANTHVLIDDAGDLAALGQRAFERGRVRELRRRSDGQLLGPRDGDRERRQRESLQRVA